jgi:hypothetical protein
MWVWQRDASVLYNSDHIYVVGATWNTSTLRKHRSVFYTDVFRITTGGYLKYILCVNTDLCYTQTYNGRKKRLVICVGRPAVMPKSIPQTCTDLCFAQICQIHNRIRQIWARRRLDIFFYRSSTAKNPVELQTGRRLSNSNFLRIITSNVRQKINRINFARQVYPKYTFHIVKHFRWTFWHRSVTKHRHMFIVVIQNTSVYNTDLCLRRVCISGSPHYKRTSVFCHRSVSKKPPEMCHSTEGLLRVN